MRALSLGVLAIAIAGCAAPQAAGPESILPLAKLRLYETGVGYFERSGSVGAGSRASLPVPAGHIDDALKTLVVLSANGRANVQGVEFGSSVSRGMARAMAGLPLVDGERPITYRDLLLSLRGASVEVRAGRSSCTGRLVDVVGSEESDEPKKDPPKGEAAKPPPLPLTILVL